MNFDIVIKNGKVIDGTGNPWFKSDLGIKDGRIAKLSPTPLKEADIVIDAKGSLVCPGFINLHSHTDGSILRHNNAENCLAMGLVTELTGNCGSSVAPLTEEYREHLKETRRQTLNMMGVELDWITLGEWMKRLEKKGIGINIAPLVGHGTLRACAMGVEGKGGERVVPTEDEMSKMKEMLDLALKEGAYGLSTGLNYAPGRNALTTELVELARVVAKYGGVYASHMRCEGDKLLEATGEFIEICEKAGIRGTISHHKASGSNNYGKACETVRMVERARARDIDIIIDQYPWRYGGTTKSLGARAKLVLPEKGLEISTREELVEGLRNQDTWEILKSEIHERREKELELHKIRKKELQERGGWTSTPYAKYVSGTILYSKNNPELENKSYEEVAKAFGKEDIWEGIRSLLISDEGYTSAGGEPYSEDDIITILKYPWNTVSTDQYAMDNSKVSRQDAADALAMQHPRGWGTYAKILGKYVREEKVLTLEEAIRKMTSLPARFLGLQDRGIVREGFWADLVVFNPEKVKCLATYADPHLFPEGIPYVFVNGQVAIDKGKPTGALAGKALRYSA